VFQRFLFGYLLIPLISTSAYAYILPTDLAGNVKSAETIVDATIISVSPQTWTPFVTPNAPTWIHAGESQVCGITYTLHVNESLKGKSATEIVLGSTPTDKLSKGTRAIFFLSHSVGFGGGDVVYEKSKGERECEQRLPELKVIWSSTAQLVSGEWAVLTVLPIPPELHQKMLQDDGSLKDALTPQQILEQNINVEYGQRVVKWTELREWILKFANSSK
jgi:DNA-directed RNA polymerase beta' subunit